MGQQDLKRYKESVKEYMTDAVTNLQKYLSLQTVSAQSKAIPETVAYVVKQIEDINGETIVLDELGGNPVIYGYFAAGENGDSTKTLLFYNHYDVQPPEPLEEWDTEPFEPTIIDGKLFARGASDNKGDLMARLTAIKLLQNQDGGLPCNVKFLIEGEEEIGSPNLAPYLEKYQELFQADACIWEFGGKDEKERISMVAGIKGMAYLELTCVGADIDMHSSVGAYVDNAAWRLVQALATMKNEQNDILVEGFYDGIIEPTEEEKKVVSELPFNEEAVIDLYGLKRPLITKAKGIDPRTAMVFHPTMTICGLDSGYTGEGAKTVLPKIAKAKLDCRLVPGQDPNHILLSVKKHLEKHGFNDIEVQMINGQKAYRSNYNHPFIDHVLESAKEVYENDVILSPNAAGTGPMYIFGEHLKLPIVSTGVGWVGSKAHAPNESIRIKDFEDGIVHMAYMLNGFSSALETKVESTEVNH
ncbi:M20/M25/M40 family metallo-hydrolase [Heyndrickxia oleronia]|jgi:acetylornithine deacetylase/succinyl-diaminopimelate desuccinylase-like protein|uniref:Acetylornithine deacetylase n=2 Tax=Heyndrickxia oleronia TaxID=38875 RepID=A0A8E2I5Q9_9BACI|nr:M20/M25/M40 family metallo-hydrolase [Heyndrickxia oleronia]MCM3457053.1 M20/M25/M40 family metallo-hydrolase [Heyndrickxia oleronia]MEC1377496.1 M20/M25/M40 family metallo-hydrolase [Heyndrickxia oleronia]OOP66588.1 acetylornithine deacetylase [Heyndrickxia oleronia]QQZ02842.1 M20/M25/M40 family metallo-hydrolase [Heyndrickxia oleronia]